MFSWFEREPNFALWSIFCVRNEIKLIDLKVVNRVFLRFAIQKWWIIFFVTFMRFANRISQKFCDLRSVNRISQKFYDLRFVNRISQKFYDLRFTICESHFAEILYDLRFTIYELRIEFRRNFIRFAICDLRIVNRISQKFYSICDSWIVDDCDGNVHQLHAHSLIVFSFKKA